MPLLPGTVRPESCLKYIVYHPLQIILLITLITLLFALQIPSLRFETSIYDLTIEDLPETLEYNQFKKEFGCEEIILVVAGTDSVFQPETFRQIDRLARSLSKIDGVRRVISFGVMGWFGIPLSMATSLIASIAIGLAVDDTIHYLVSYNREFKGDLNKEKALSNTVRSMGKPIIFTTVTIGLGFSVLMFSHFKPTAIFGLLMVITMFSALVADLVPLPSLMLHVELVTIWDLLKLKLGKDPQKGIPLFKGLSRTQVHYILMAGALKTHESGTIIFKKGEVSDSMYAVISGELEVVDLAEEDLKDGNQGSKRIISILKSGDVVGEMGMIRSCRRSATVIASKGAELLQINDRMIRRLQWLYPPTAHRFFYNLMTILCDRLEKLTRCYLDETVTDGLSGLYTRDFFISMLEKEIARARRYKAPLSVFVLSLDNLSALISRYGHRAGDRLIAETGRLLKQQAGKTDFLCRYDSSRFAGMLTHTAGQEARALCDRIKTLLTSSLVQVESEPIQIKVSFGVAVLDPESDRDMKGLLSDAVQALRRAEDEGVQGN